MRTRRRARAIARSFRRTCNGADRKPADPWLARFLLPEKLTIDVCFRGPAMAESAMESHALSTIISYVIARSDRISMTLCARKDKALVPFEAFSRQMSLIRLPGPGAHHTRHIATTDLERRSDTTD